MRTGIENARPHFERAGRLLSQNRPFEAIEWLNRGVAYDPNPICLIRLAELELTFNDPQAALTRALEGLELDPGDAMGHVLAAKSLVELGRADEAERYWRSAISLTRDAEQVRLIRARFHLQRGEFDKGLNEMADLTEMFPDHPAAYCAIAMNRLVTEEDGYLLEGLDRLIAVADRRNTVHLRYALGKAFDDLGRYEEAIAQFDAANALCFQPGFDAKVYRDEIDRRSRSAARAAVGELREQASESDLPIFVVGMIRSGTTLVEQILASHPDVAGAGEQPFWIAAESSFVDPATGCVKSLELLNAADTYQSLLKRFSNGKLRVVDKQPGNMVLAGTLHAVFPQARIIYMHRHPADNALSIWATHMRTSAPFAHSRPNIVVALREHDRLLEHWRSVIPPERLLPLAYEELVDEREPMIRRLVEFCGLAWNDKCLTPERSRSRVRTPSLWQARQPIYRSSVGRWKNYVPWLEDFTVLTH